MQKKGLIVEQSPVDELLGRAGGNASSLQTAVTDFSQKHDEGLTAQAAGGGFYKNLIPLSAPSEGEQYAFQVDLDLCTGCKGCVTACHSLNGLDNEETWRDVGLLISEAQEDYYQQTVTTACHHCVDPGCLNGCPVLAYDKDEVTGIVSHLDDQCIGCQYCVMKCPYDVPKYSKDLGIVRKCDMCQGRLAEGEAPACVQGCPTQAISIALVKTEEVVAQSQRSEGFLPASPDPAYTQPTTRYTSKRPIPPVQAADHMRLEPEHTHWPLVVMLVITQWAAGISLWQALAGSVLAQGSLFLPYLSAAIFTVGIIVSVAHLGQPLGAWRAFMGLRKSWLSREIVVFGGALKLLWLMALAATFFAGHSLLPLGQAATAATALLGVFCSVMVYHDTARPFWHWWRGALRFLGSAVLLGSATVAVALPWVSSSPSSSDLFSLLMGLVILVSLAKFCGEGQILSYHNEEGMSWAKRSALLQLQPLRQELIIRWVAGINGGIILPVMALVAGQSSALWSVSVLASLLVAEVSERVLFFKAVEAPHMPRGMSR